MQLDCLLTSLQDNWPGHKITIIWKATSTQFWTGYVKLFGRFPDVTKWEETILKRDTLQFLEDEYTCFFVDDCIVFRKLEFRIIDLPTYWITHSLRLGSNCKHYPGSTIFKWDRCLKNFRYPFSLDGHIYKTEYIKSLIQKIEFTNPNQLEMQLQQFTNYAPKFMSCEEQSCVVSIPANKVSDTSSCHTSNKYPPEELNKLYLQGKRIDYKQMNFTFVNDCHQEIDYVIH